MSDELDDLREQTRGTDRISASTDEEETEEEEGDAADEGGTIEDTEAVTEDASSSEEEAEEELEVEVELELESEVEDEIGVEVEAEMDSEVESAEDVEVEVEVDAEGGAEVGVEYEVEVDDEVEVEVDVGVEEGGSDDAPEPSSEFRDTYETNARRARRGVNPRSFSADDPGLSALLLSLQQTDELEQIGEAIRGELGAPEPPEYDQDAVVRLALTYAVSETAPDYFKVLANGSR